MADVEKAGGTGGTVGTYRQAQINTIDTVNKRARRAWRCCVVYIANPWVIVACGFAGGPLPMTTVYPQFYLICNKEIIEIC